LTRACAYKQNATFSAKSQKKQLIDNFISAVRRLTVICSREVDQAQRAKLWPPPEFKNNNRRRDLTWRRRRAEHTHSCASAVFRRELRRILNFSSKRRSFRAPFFTFALPDSILIATQFNETSNFVLLPAPHSSRALAS
jgi:hypothetical protein